MILYVYDKDTKEYRGEIGANLDPLESALQGREIFVVPPYCTPVKPKSFKDNKVNIYNELERSWTLIEDNRGLTVYNKKTREESVINGLGPIPTGFTINKPFDLQEYKDEILEKLNVAYSKAQSTSVKVGKVEVTLDDRFSLAKVLEFLTDEHPTYFFDMKDESVELGKEYIEKIIKELYERSVFLPKRRNEFLDKIRSARSKKALDMIKEEIVEFK